MQPQRLRLGCSPEQILPADAPGGTGGSLQRSPRAIPQCQRRIEVQLLDARQITGPCDGIERQVIAGGAFKARSGNRDSIAEFRLWRRALAAPQAGRQHQCHELRGSDMAVA